MATRPDDDIRPEPVRGLPEALPPGERIVWQGAPSPWRLTVDALKARWVAGWFALLAFWRAGATLADGTLADAGRVVATYALICGIVLAILWACGWVMAKATVYTLTNRRVVMRIGAALTLTLQIPLDRIGAADLSLARSGHGTIALTPIGAGDRLSYWHLWPHARPWRARAPQPALRSIPDAAGVADLIARHATGAPMARPAADAPMPDAVPAE